MDEPEYSLPLLGQLCHLVANNYSQLGQPVFFPPSERFLSPKVGPPPLSFRQWVSLVMVFVLPTIEVMSIIEPFVVFSVLLTGSLIFRSWLRSFVSAFSLAWKSTSTHWSLGPVPLTLAWQSEG